MWRSLLRYAGEAADAPAAPALTQTKAAASQYAASQHAASEDAGSQDTVGEAARSEDAGVAGRSEHSSMAQVTPGGLRLYDAQGSWSIVPLQELRHMMQKLSFSRSATKRSFLSLSSFYDK